MELDDTWLDLQALRKLYGLLHQTGGAGSSIAQGKGRSGVSSERVEASLDERSKSLLKWLLDEATRRTIQSHAKVFPRTPTPSGYECKETTKPMPFPSPSPAVDETRGETPSVASDGCQPACFLARPTVTEPKRPMKQRQPVGESPEPMARSGHTPGPRGRSHQSHAKVFPRTPTPSGHECKETTKPPPFPSPSPAVDETRGEPPSVASDGCQPACFLARPTVTEPKRPMKQRQPLGESPEPMARPGHTPGPRGRSHQTHHARRMGTLPPSRQPGSPLTVAGASRRTPAQDTESPPGLLPTRRDAAASWVIVPASPAQAAVRLKRTRMENDRRPKMGRSKAESTREGHPNNQVEAELGRPMRTNRDEERPRAAGVTPGRHGRSSGRLMDGRIKQKDSPDQTAKIDRPKGQLVERKKEPPDRLLSGRTRGSSSAMDCSICPAGSRSMRRRRMQIRGSERRRSDPTVRDLPLANRKARRGSSAHLSRPRQRKCSSPRGRKEPADSDASCRTCSSPTPTRRSSGSGCYYSDAAPRRKPRWRTATRQGSVGGPAAIIEQRSMRLRGTVPTGHRSSSSRRVIPPLSVGARPSTELVIRRKEPPRQSAASARTKTAASSAMTKVGRRNKEEKKDGRLRRLKDKLGVIFHHHHHHYHHHHPPSSDPERRHHRSIGELLRGIVHHTAGKRAADGVRRPSQQQQQQHGYLHMLLEELLRHLWRGGKRREQRPPRPGKAVGRVAAKKLHWWQRLRRRRGVRLGSRRRRRLRLGFGGKVSSVGRNGRGKK